MTSKVLSVLKIVAVAMMLVWALGGPTQANAQQTCSSSCANQCAVQMGLCTQYGEQKGVFQTYWSWQQGGCLSPDPCPTPGNIPYYECLYSFSSCMAGCGCQVSH